MRILYVTTIGGTMCFFPDHIKMLLDEGHTVEVACNTDISPAPEYCREWNLKVHNLPFSRAPLNKENFTAYKMLKRLVETGRYDIVHTHTPNASACARLACRKLRKSGLKVFYTAHGFHFYKGAPLKNWLIYYPVEKLCSRWTDVLITINQEDYALAQKRMKAKRVEYIPGVGIDLSKFSPDRAGRSQKRKELGIPEQATLLLSVGELNDNKNHETVIQAICNMDVFYIIAGTGEKEGDLQRMIDRLDLGKRVKLLGYRSDVRDLYGAADLFVFPSFREGLSVSLMEAMASGLPCAVSKIRGNVDLIDPHGGALFDPHSPEDCAAAIDRVLSANRGAMGEYNLTQVKTYGTACVVSQMMKLYHD